MVGEMLKGSEGRAGCVDMMEGSLIEIYWTENEDSKPILLEGRLLLCPFFFKGVMDRGFSLDSSTIHTNVHPLNQVKTNLLCRWCGARDLILCAFIVQEGRPVCLSVGLVMRGLT